MIDPLIEDLVSLPEASKLCPPRRSSKKPSISCLYRWTASGCRGVILESIQVGGTRCTSREALARFFNALTYGDDVQPQQSLDRTTGNVQLPKRTPTQRHRAIAEAERTLLEEGA